MESLIERADRNKRVLDEYRPFDEKQLKQIRDYYRIDLTYASNALEGNTLTISETKVLLEDGLTVGGKPIRDYYEAAGHAQAYDYMFEHITGRRITEEYIKQLHRLFYSNIDGQNAGSYRKENVLITGSSYPVADQAEIARAMEELAGWIARERETLHPIVFAALLHKKFVFIHPFIDGNGRVARLLMNTALLQDRYLPVIIPPVLRGDYIGLLERAHTDDRPFVELVVEQEIETQKDYARMLHIKL